MYRILSAAIWRNKRLW